MRLGAYERENLPVGNDAGLGDTPELVEWFSVSGDMDDFIYYGEEKTCSER